MGLSHPITSKVLFREGDSRFRVAACSMQGYRSETNRIEMEDAHAIQLALKKNVESAFFGVFDGHNGSEAANWCAKNLPLIVDQIDGSGHQFNEDKLVQACLDCDEQFFKYHDDKYQHKDTSGSTCIFSLVERTPADQPSRLIVANIGDSRCLLSVKSQDNCIALSEDHKPENPIEAQRIKNAGGFVAMGRVDGQLALSRAFGDRAYKGNSTLGVIDQKVIAVPQIREFTMQPGDFLLLSCDGIFEAFDNDQTISHLAQLVKKHEDDIAVALAAFLDEVLGGGSQDNMTVILIQKKDGTDYNRPPELLPGNYVEFSKDESSRNHHLHFASLYGFDEEAMENAAKADIVEASTK